MKYDCINGGEEMGITFKYEVVPKKGRKIKNGIKKVKGYLIILRLLLTMLIMLF